LTSELLQKLLLRSSTRRLNGYASTWVYREIATHARVAGEGFSTLSREQQEAVAELLGILQKEKAFGMNLP